MSVYLCYYTLYSHSTEMGQTDGKRNRKKYCSECV